jgi:hypothetical protein
MAKSAYEKMFEDGSAFKPIKIAQPTPDNPTGGMIGHDPERNIDESVFDDSYNNSMDDIVEKAKSIKAAKTGKPISDFTPRTSSSSGMIKTENKKVKELERRVAMLEQALQLVMETQTKLLKES